MMDVFSNLLPFNFSPVLPTYGSIEGLFELSILTITLNLEIVHAVCLCDLKGYARHERQILLFKALKVQKRKSL